MPTMHVDDEQVDVRARWQSLAQHLGEGEQGNLVRVGQDALEQRIAEETALVEQPVRQRVLFARRLVADNDRLVIVAVAVVAVVEQLK